MNGTAGADTLDGGAGADRLYGGIGADVFRFGATLDAGDRIFDFAAANDTIALSAGGFGGGLVAGPARRPPCCWPRWSACPC
jgi:serralysin